MSHHHWHGGGWLVAFGTGGLREPSRTKLREAGILFTDSLKTFW
jgi:hypothetical protein